MRKSRLTFKGTIFLMLSVCITPFLSLNAQTNVRNKNIGTTLSDPYTEGRNIKLMKLRTGRGMADSKLISNSKKLQKTDMLTPITDKHTIRPIKGQTKETLTIPASMKKAGKMLSQPTPQSDALMFTSASFENERDKSYDKMDSKMAKLDLPNSLTITAAANKIISASGAKTVKQKSRAIYSWIAQHIEYDTTAKIRSGEEAFEQRKGISEGYAKLYKEMAQAAGLECYFVIGYLKPWGYEKGMDLDYHAWNIVTDGKENIILDVALSAGYMNDSLTAYTFDFDDEWFDVDPYLMIYSHYPKCGQFQYINTYLTPEQFKDIPRLEADLKWAGIDERNMQSYMYGHKKSWSPYIFNNNEAFRKGIKINKIQMTNTLQKGKEYRFNFTIPEGMKVWAQNGDENYEINNELDAVIKPNNNGKLKFVYAQKNAPVGHPFIYYNIEDEEPIQTYMRVNTLSKKNSYTPSEADVMCLSNVNPQKQLVIYPGRKEIQWDEFRGRTDFESVEIPINIRKIGYRAFENCTNLKKVIIPNTTEEVEGRAYLGCSNLSYATIGAQTIKTESFWECNRLEKISFTGTVKEIGKSAFAFCTKLTDVSLGEATNKVGEWAFWAGGGQMRLYLPERVNEIGEYVINPADKIVVPATSYSRQYAQNKGFMYLIEE